MRPFGCHVTILNTLDYLGKFDGKSDEGFFVRYSLNSKAFRVYNIRTRKVEENLHIRFLKDKPIIAGDGPKWLFDIDVLTKSMNYVPVVAGTNFNDLVDGSLFDSSSKNANNDEPQRSSDAEKKDDECVNKESRIDDQERPGNNTQDVNTAGPSINTASTNVNTGSLNINTVSPTVTTAPLEATHADFFGDETELDMSNITTTYPVSSTPNTRIHKDHSLDHVIGDIQSGVLTRRMTKTSNEQGFISTVYEGKTHEDLHTCLFACFLSQVEPKKVIQALTDPSWIEAMQDELLQFKLQKVWTLVDLPYGKRAIETKWVYRNKKNERFARIEAIRLFLAYASFKDFVVYQMDVNSAFLYGKIEEEVYVCQPPGFEDLEFPDRVYKVEKALYGLHEAPRAWYETLFTYLLDNGFQRGQIAKTLFIKRVKGDILLVQDKYVDEILKKFGFSTVKIASTPMETSKPLLKDAEAEDVDAHIYRSMIGSLMYLIASRPDIMFVVCAYARFQVTPKVSHLHVVKRIFRYLKGQPKLGLWYPKDSPFDLKADTDSDYAGASLDRKSTAGGCQFLGIRLISWQCKKQTIVANSTTEAEYVAAASCCGQVLWIQNQMLDYGYNFMNTKIFINNESTICIVKNPMFHSKTKHIEIRHHFIRDSNEKKLIQMIKIHTDQNVADLLTKAFDVGRFQYLIARVGRQNGKAATTTSSLEAEQDSGNINRTQSMATLNESFPQGTDSGSGPRCQDTTLGGAEAQIRFETASKQSNDPPLSRVNTLGSGKDNMKLNELMDLCTKLPEKFWNTAAARTLDNREMKITATIDGEVKIVSEASIRRHLKLEDSDGISNLPTTEIFEQLALMRSPTQTNVADEAASTGVDVRHGGATTTVTSLDAGQGSGNINKTPTMPHDSPLPRVHTLRSDEGIMQHNELMDLVTKLSDRVVALETDLQQTKKVYGTAFTKLIKKVKKLEKTVKTRQARRKARIVVSSDEEDLEDPSKQGRKIAKIDQDLDISLVQHDAEVQGRHEHDMESDFEFIAVKEVYTVEKKLVLLSQFPLLVLIQPKTRAKIDEEERQRIARVQEAASSLNIEEWDDIQARVEADEEFVQKLQSDEREMYYESEKARLLAKLINERKRYFAAQRAEERRNKPLTQNLFETTIRRVHTFVPMESESEIVILELAAGSSKKDAEEELVQESSKRLKTGESSVPAEEPKDKEEELSQERIHQIMIIVPEQGMNVEALQTMPKSKNVKVRVNTEESAVKTEPELKNTIECNLNPSDGPGKPNSISMKTVKTKWALNHLQQPICVQLTKTVKTLKAQS
ncbi:putative ribonuclease H-like domain-containing protein [Tanacetum coccineum]